ncbi:MAG: hypothetical protein O2890_12820 [Cyanobacteria bacterium]|nr:hypothetical protein [Cyanobacteriota bacterium]MDA0867272.1 hypothetical protein [Cyanobacteriota bacterium]
MIKQLGLAAIAVGLVAVTPLAAEAARLSVDGRIQLKNTAQPLDQARVTITFHGHELGIHEYTTTQTLRVRTDADGGFAAETKVRDGRYHWTHATIIVGPTDISKSHEFQCPCVGSDAEGWVCSKDFWVSPMATELEAPLQSWLEQLQNA